METGDAVTDDDGPDLRTAAGAHDRGQAPRSWPKTRRGAPADAALEQVARIKFRGSGHDREWSGVWVATVMARQGRRARKTSREEGVE